MRTTWGGPGSASAGWCFPGLNQKASKAGRALADFALPSARCQPSQLRHCRRVVRLGANTLHGVSAVCPKRRVRRRTVTRPPRESCPYPSAARRKGRAALIQMLRPAPRRPEKKCDPNKNLPRAGESTPRNVPRGTFRRPAILQKQCSTWNIVSKIRSAPPRNSHYI